MLKLYKSKDVLHSIVWLVLYLAANTITGNLATILNANYEVVSFIPIFILATVCFIYLYKTGISKDIGLLCRPTESAKNMMCYIPLFVLPAYSLIYGINNALTPLEILAAFLMYTGVGFMEEIVFRGLMFRALTKKWNRIVVVVFISLTFGMGHIVSVVAVGMSSFDTMLQIINASVVGFMFMTVMLASDNLTACIIAHIAYNFLVTICMSSDDIWTRIIVNTVITFLYFTYLFFSRKNIRNYFKQTTEWRTI